MQIRAATLDDLERLAAFMGRCTLAHQGVRRESVDEMRTRLTQPGTDLDRDTWVVESGGEIEGFGQVWTESPHTEVVCYVRVDPKSTGRGIGSALLERAASRAADLVSSETPLHATSWPGDEAAAPLLEAMGFEPLRYFSLMTAALGEPEAPIWPPDVRVRPLDAESELRPVFDARTEVFDDRRAELGEWLHEYVGNGFDPTLWFIAEDDQGIVGFALCLPELSEDPDAGYVSELGVREDRRGEGLGLALLQHTFVEFRRRGKARVSLHVDTDNLTGAVRLYERAGMAADPRLVVWKRE